MRFSLRLIVSAAALLLVVVAIGEAKTPTRFGFYNVQNLFDTINDPGVNDAEFSDSTKNKYDRKLTELAAAIALFDPDILGVCEVENYGVLADLSRRTARLNSIIHYNSRDTRGIDVALLFDSTKYRQVSSELHKVKFVARDFLRAELSSTKDNRSLVIYVAHLPSKRGGAGAALRRERAMRVIDSLSGVEMVDALIFCGDMNDDPTERRILYNTALRPFLAGVGSYAYRDVWSMLDQIMVSPSLKRSLKGDQMVVCDSSLVTLKGRYTGYPRRNRPSDHFPVYIDFTL